MKIRTAIQRERTQSAARTSAERDALAELERWSARAVPDDSAPLDADHLVRVFSATCISALALDADIASGFTVNTVHYYRRKETIDPPHGRTAAARYHRRHLWQIAGARLAGYLGLVTLAEARDAFRDADEDDLRAFLATRVAEARARDVLRAPATVARETAGARERPRPLPGVRGAISSASLISLPGGAMCVLPAEHYARHSGEAARDLVRALARALNVQIHSEAPMSTFHVPTSSSGAAARRAHDVSIRVRSWTASSSSAPGERRRCEHPDRATSLSRG
jgi:hypothetical protein